MSHANVLLALAFAGGVVLAVRAQSTPPPTPSTWPPKPDQIVAIASSAGSIPVGGSLVVYEVPWDRWLVITDWSLPNQNQLELLEDKNGATTTRISAPFLQSTATGFGGLTFAPRVSGPGVAFGPRSKVVLHDAFGSGSGSYATAYTFLGYLAQL